jgi:hypothetical protein
MSELDAGRFIVVPLHAFRECEIPRMGEAFVVTSITEDSVALKLASWRAAWPLVYANSHPKHGAIPPNREIVDLVDSLRKIERSARAAIDAHTTLIDEEGRAL